MITADLQDSRIVLSGEWRDKDRIKMLPGSKWDTKQATWWMPLSWGSCMALRGMFQNELAVGPALNTWALEWRRIRIDPVLSIRQATHYAGREDVKFAFQEPGVDFLCYAVEALLGDDMGTGKTRQAVLALRKMLLVFGIDIFPVVIFCPNSVKSQWFDHITEFLPEAEPFLIGGGKQKREKLLAQALETPNAVVIINMEAAMLHSRLQHYGSIALSDKEKVEKELNELQPRTTVVDEAHRMKNPTAKVTRAIWRVQHNPRSTIRWAMTGTPIANDAGDLWAILHGVSPGDYPTKSEYIDRYCMQTWAANGGLNIIGLRPDTKDEFFAVFDAHYRRMPKDLVLPYLPKKVRVRREAEMKPSQARAYKEMADGMIARTDDGELIIATNNLTKNTRLLQFSSASVFVEPEVQPDGSVKDKVHLTKPSNKIDELLGIVEDAGKPIVVCAESRQLIELAATELIGKGIPVSVYVGGMTQDQKDAVKRDFIEGRTRVFLFTIKTGGTGLDGLQSQADTLVFLQRSWSMIDNKQAEDRIHRIGSEVHGESITIIDVVAPGTIEEDQIKRLYEKMERLDEITRDRAVLAAAGQDTTELDREEAGLLSTPLWVA
jgi:SNF2 family DNA or RNA helicase